MRKRPYFPSLVMIVCDLERVVDVNLIKKINFLD